MSTPYKTGADAASAAKAPSVLHEPTKDEHAIKVWRDDSPAAEVLALELYSDELDGPIGTEPARQ